MMQKRVLILLIVILFLPSISAIDIILSKGNYAPHETLQAQITGSFVYLNPEKIFIYEEGKPRSSPVIRDLTKQDNIYYFYAILPDKEGNFTLRIEDVDFIRSGELKTATLIKNFTIQASSPTLSVNPGFLFAEDLSVKVKSFGGDMDITSELEETGETKTIHLVEEMEETLKFSSSPQSKKSNLKINNYNVPVFALKKEEKVQEKTIELEFIPVELTGKIIPKKYYLFDVVLKNYGEEDLTNVKLSCDFNASVNPKLISVLQKNTSVHINITIRVEKIENLSGKILAESQNKTIILPIFFELTQEKEDVNINGTSITETLSCYNIGQICLDNAECDGEITSSLEGSCCLGQCIEKTKINYSWLIGILLFVILIIILLIVFLKVRRRQKPKSVQEIIKERSGRYEQRIKSREVRDDLEKI